MPQHPSPSPELERLIRYVVARSEREDTGPVYPEDVAEALEYHLFDSEIAIICRTNPGPPAVHPAQCLCFSSELRRNLFLELMELELNNWPCVAAGPDRGAPLPPPAAQDSQTPETGSY